MALRRNDAAIVIGRYARTTLVWKAQARALIKVRNLAGACSHAARPAARLTAPAPSTTLKKQTRRRAFGGKHSPGRRPWVIVS